MLSTTGQQMLEWTRSLKNRPVVIDLAESEADSNQGIRSQTAVDTADSESTHDLPGAVRVRVTGLDGDPLPGPGSRLPVDRGYRLDRLSREQLIDEIIASNPSATVSFLSEFEEPGLRLYLRRLRNAQMGRGLAGISERVAESPAIVARVRTI